MKKVDYRKLAFGLYTPNFVGYFGKKHFLFVCRKIKNFKQIDTFVEVDMFYCQIKKLS